MGSSEFKASLVYRARSKRAKANYIGNLFQKPEQ